MANGSYIAMSAAAAVHKQLEVVANNIANASTTGFKQQRVRFEHVLVQAQSRDVTPSKGYVNALESTIDFSQGPLTKTGNPLDVALHGPGFFAVQGDDGPLLTRDGAFSLAPDGTLIDSSGRAVLVGTADAAPETIAVQPALGPVEINESGEIIQKGTLIGKLRMVDVPPGTPTTLVGKSAFRVDPQAFQPVNPQTRVIVEHLESSNVNSITNLTKLIEINRSYSATQKIMEKYSHVDSKVISTLT